MSLWSDMSRMDMRLAARRVAGGAGGHSIEFSGAEGRVVMSVKGEFQGKTLSGKLTVFLSGDQPDWLGGYEYQPDPGTYNLTIEPEASLEDQETTDFVIGLALNEIARGIEAGFEHTGRP